MNAPHPITNSTPDDEQEAAFWRNKWYDECEMLRYALERIIVELDYPSAPANADVAVEIALTAVGRGCNACWGQQCDECPFDEAGYQRTIGRQSTLSASALNKAPGDGGTQK